MVSIRSSDTPLSIPILALTAVCITATGILTGLGYGLWLVVGLIALGVGILSAWRSDIGLFLYLIAGNVAAELSRRLGDTYPVGLGLDVIAIATVIGVMARIVTTRKQLSISSRNSAYVVTIILVAYSLAMIVNPNYGDASLEMRLQGLRLIALPPFFIFVAREHVSCPRIYRRFFDLILILGLLQSVVGILQQTLGVDALSAAYSSYGSDYASKVTQRAWGGEIRAFGWLNEPYVAAIAVAVAVLYCLTLVFYSRTGRKWVNLAIIAVLATMLVFSFTRIIWIAVLVAGGVLRMRPRRITYLGIVLILIVLLFALMAWFLMLPEIGSPNSAYVERVVVTLRDPIADPSISLRLSAIQYAWDVATQTFLGLGPGTTHAVAVKYGFWWGGVIPSADNQFGQYLVELGFPGLLLVLILLSMVLRAGWRGWQHALELPLVQEESVMILVSFICMILLLISCLSGMFLTTPPTSYYFWYIAGILLAQSNVAVGEVSLHD